MPIPPKRTGPPKRLVGEDESAAIPVSLDPPKKRSASESAGLARIPAPTRAAAVIQEEVWTIGGKVISCPHCQSQKFQLRKGDTNALVCETCTRIEWFVGEPAFGPPPPEKIPKQR